MPQLQEQVEGLAWRPPLERVLMEHLREWMMKLLKRRVHFSAAGCLGIVRFLHRR